jgi:hypothetical protein
VYKSRHFPGISIEVGSTKSLVRAMDVIRKEKTAESAIDTARALDVGKEPELEGQSHERKNITLEDDIEHLRLQYGVRVSLVRFLANPLSH